MGSVDRDPTRLPFPLPRSTDARMMNLRDGSISIVIIFLSNTKGERVGSRENERARDGCKLAIPRAIYQNKLSLQIGDEWVLR